MDEKNPNEEGVAGDENVKEGKSAAPTESAEQKPRPQPANKESKMWAMLCHLLGLFTCFVGPLIIWLIKKDEDAFVDDQGKEALNFQITVLLAFIVSGILTTICIGAFMLAAVGVGNLVFCIVASVKSNNGEAYRYPVCLRLIK
jgi:uncharacterized Tic20 family protein